MLSVKLPVHEFLGIFNQVRIPEDCRPYSNKMPHGVSINELQNWRKVEQLEGHSEKHAQNQKQGSQRPVVLFVCEVFHKT